MKVRILVTLGLASVTLAVPVALGEVCPPHGRSPPGQMTGRAPLRTTQPMPSDPSSPAAQRRADALVGMARITLDDGTTRPLDIDRLRRLVAEACSGLEAVTVESILDDTCRNLFDGVKERDVSQALVMSARTLIEKEPNYSYAAARLLMDMLRREALGFLRIDTNVATQQEMGERYSEYFTCYIKCGADLELLDKRLTQYDLARLGAALKPERDLQFTYLGLQTLYDRYFIHSHGTRFELPQAFFMRVAMGLAINEIDREGQAIEFYNLLSSFDFMSSTPTLFNSGTLRPQLSSCYLTTVPDDLDGIYGAIKDNALLSKFAGGLGNDWTRVRGMGAHIKGTNGKSQGVVPFLKVANDTAVGPPRHVQWVAEPRWQRHHELTPSVNVMVSSAGRLFAIVDYGPNASLAMPPSASQIAVSTSAVASSKAACA